MQHKFFADNVTVLKFSREEDEEGAILPPDAVAQIPTRVPVIFDSPDQARVGWAKIHRFNNSLIANIELISKMKSSGEAVVLIQKLYPAIILTVLGCHANVITEFRVEGLLLTSSGNVNPTIGPLGTNGIFRGSAEVMN